MTYLKIQHAPVAILLIVTTGLSICYTFNKLEGKIRTDVPFISEIGMFQWEAGIFSATLMSAAVLLLLTQYLRFRWILLVLPKPTLFITLSNVFGFVIGMASVVGMIGVAVFPVSTAGRNHELASILCFTCAVMYMATQSVISFKMCPGSTAGFVRFGLTIAAAASYFITLVFGQKGRTDWQSGHYNHEFWERLPEDKGYNDLLISALAEWAMVYIIIFMCLTFMQDFRRMTVLVLIKSRKLQCV